MSFDGQWKRYGCCPFDQDDLPSPLKNMVVMEITGYYYRDTPQWFNSTGQKLIPSQSSVVYDKLYYRFTFYKSQFKNCLSGGQTYYLSTFEDIMPVIHEAISGRRMKVRRMSRWNGQTSWAVFC